MRQTFCKEERLSSRYLIRDIVQAGRSFSVPPLRTTWKQSVLDVDFPVQVLFAVPKSNFKRAVKRNLIRRRMREAYRLNKERMYAALKGNQIGIMIVYTSKAVMEYSAIEKAMILTISRLEKEVKAVSTKSI